MYNAAVAVVNSEVVGLAPGMLDVALQTTKMCVKMSNVGILLGVENS
jgi:hypothetical protein